MLEVLKEVLGLEEKSCEVAFENKDSAVLKTQKDLGTGWKGHVPFFVPSWSADLP